MEEEYERGEPSVDEYSLPIRYSIVSLTALQHLIGTLYGWTNVRCQLIKGTMRDVYEVWADGEHAVFCLYRHGERREEEIEAELRIMAHLHEHGITVPLPIRLQNGDVLFALRQPEGIRYGMMITFLCGKPIGRQFDDEVGAAVGRLLASVHQSFRALSAPLDRPLLHFQSALTAAIEAFGNAAPHRSHDVVRLRVISDTLLREFTLTPETSPYGLLHGDIIPSNILIDGDGLALLDFDLCAFGWQLYDVASMLVEIAYWGMGTAVEAAFLQGYQKERPLTLEERAALPILQSIRCILSLGTPARHIDTWGRVYFYDAIIDKQLAIVDKSVGGP